MPPGGPPDRPWRPLPNGDGVEIAVRVTPRGGRDRVAGIVRDADGRPSLSLRVSVPPEGGRANEAATALVARSLGMSKSAVTLTRGAASRLKLFAARGDPRELAKRLEDLASDE